MVDYSKQVQIRMPQGIYDRIEQEIEGFGEHRTVTEFTLDAVKWYLDYRTNQRIESAKVRSEVTVTEDLHLDR